MYFWSQGTGKAETWRKSAGQRTSKYKAWNTGGCGTFVREWEDKDRKEHSQRDSICCGFNLQQILRMLTSEIKL